LRHEVDCGPITLHTDARARSPSLRSNPAQFTPSRWP
jgi:hypothetical protein